jgi:hypothetical protein
VISDIDEVLKKMLTDEIEIKGNEIDISFDQPKREWSSRLGKPTLNVFLFDLRENLRLRGAEQYVTIRRPDGTAEVRRNLVRMDLRYLVTAWLKDAEDEHLLLSSALIALLRNPFIPKKYLSENLQGQPSPIPLEVATFPTEKGPMDKFSEIWGVLDNEMRAGILLTITLAIDPYRPMVFRQVTSREISFFQQDKIDPQDETVGNKTASKEYWAIGGKLESNKYDPSNLKVLLVEQDLFLEMTADGGFVLPRLAQGEYHLDVFFNEKVLKRQQINVPSDDFVIQV